MTQTQGFALSFGDLSAADLQRLWQACFGPEHKPALCFNGQPGDYSQEGLETEEQVNKSLSGSAFDSRLELRWRQVAPARYKALALTEDSDLVTKLETSFGVKSKGYSCQAGRNLRDEEQKKDAPSTGAIPLNGRLSENKDSKAERRLPRPPVYQKPTNVGYVYYIDEKTSGQVVYMRLNTGGTEA